MAAASPAMKGSSRKLNTGPRSAMRCLFSSFTAPAPRSQIQADSNVPIGVVLQACFTLVGPWGYYPLPTCDSALFHAKVLRLTKKVCFGLKSKLRYAGLAPKRADQCIQQLAPTNRSREWRKRCRTRHLHLPPIGWGLWGVKLA